MDLIEDIKSFVEGRMSAKELYEKAASNPDAEDLFEGFSAKPYTNDGSLYLYIISQNYDKPDTNVNLQDVLPKFLDWKGVSYSGDNSALQEYELILKAMPSWLNPPEFYIKKLQDKIQGNDAKQARSIIKDEIKRDFLYLGKPPKWLQSPSWIFNGEKPMIFVGQLSLDALKHDTSQLYVFINLEDDTTRSIVQTA
ncbi:hypothetical protein QLH51_07990 [Sphingomonas sp. 2R-10]|uniref:hypothetical protein n=1 Tax=Sphingomonas sp. 2R-10 TaxID=3045148 RepID=UPI0024BB5ACA|nr:hypothetical protein [Sphingomonas sp. 2R-10]MDJ0276732.1 hypothetical protein [Sphingomonas sp. 2R-10]